MRLKSVVFTAALFAALPLAAQQASAPQPLTAMPYSPSLDVTSLDRTADPCVDFYKFSCGGWQKLNPIPADQASWSVYAKLGNENQQFLWGILQQDAAMKARTPVQQKVGDYFEACMNTAAIDAVGMSPLQPALMELDTLKTREQLIAAIAPASSCLCRKLSSFGSGTGQDAVDSSLIIVELGAGRVGPARPRLLHQDRP